MRRWELAAFAFVLPPESSTSSVREPPPESLPSRAAEGPRADLRGRSTPPEGNRGPAIVCSSHQVAVMAGQ